MKIIISRKGFDSGTGGVPSPILPDGRIASLPIPGGAPFAYKSLASPIGDLGAIVQQLTGGRMSGREPAHLDPDLWAGSFPRAEGWRASLGQTGAAQSHLEGEGVGVGDVFLFFGWFREAAEKDGKLAYVRGGRDVHTLFGYMQVGESIEVGADPDTKGLLAARPWLRGHPHVTGKRHNNNTIHIASDRLILDGRDTGLAGAGIFPTLQPELVLTAPGCSKSLWEVPSWLRPQEGRRPLSYHGSPQRWSDGEEGMARLQSVAKGQEFVFDAQGLPEALAWVETLAALSGPRLANNATHSATNRAAMSNAAPAPATPAPARKLRA